MDTLIVLNHLHVCLPVAGKCATVYAAFENAIQSAIAPTVCTSMELSQHAEQFKPVSLGAAI